MTDTARVASFSSLPPSRFPRWVFNPFNTANLHYRSAALCQFIILKRLPMPSAPITDHDNRYLYTILASRHDRYLAYLSLWSLVNSSSRLPSIAIGLDDDFTEDAARIFFSPLKLPSITFYTRSVVSDHLEASKCFDLAWFCRAHIFGFKLGLNLLLSAHKPILYADSDVLWFGNIAESDYFNLDSQFVAASIDCGVQPYDMELMGDLSKRFSFNTLLSPNGCAGVCLFGQSHQLMTEVDSILTGVRESHTITRLTEQTIVSALSKRDGTFLSHLFIAMEPSMTVFSRSTASLYSLGKHYPANWRTQFWIDAFHLRFLSGVR